MTRFRKSILLFSAALFLIVSMPGMAGMLSMDEQGNMPSCPYMNGAAVCKMNPLEHVAAWQSMFTALPVSTGLIAVLLFALLALVFIRIAWSVHTVEPALLYNHRFRNRPPISRHSLQEAFAKGILNTKAF